MKCPNCGASFRGGRGRCPACGYRVQVKQLTRRCPECRARVAEGARTCLMCGAALEGGRSFLPQISISMVPPAPLLGIVLGVVVLAALWFLKPWRAIQLGTYHTPTATATFTTTPTSTATPTSTPTMAPTESPTPEVTVYIVRSGDTLSLIATQFGVSVESVMAANGLTDYYIRVGQELLIPVDAPTPEASPEVSGSPSSEVTPQPESVTYVVQAGDSLSEIARRFGVTVDALMQANGITNPDALREGQELVVPGRTASSETPGIGGPPTPTVSSELVYSSPTLLGPPDGWEFRGEEAELPILLNWLSVGLLSEDEWYSVVVHEVGAQDEEDQEVVELTRATSFRVPLSARPPADDQSHLLEWNVGVVRLVEDQPDGTAESVPIGHRSETRSFFWY